MESDQILGANWELHCKMCADVVKEDDGRCSVVDSLTAYRGQRTAVSPSIVEVQPARHVAVVIESGKNPSEKRKHKHRSRFSG